LTDTKHALQQQHIKLQAEMEESNKHVAAAHHVELLAKVITRPPGQPGMKLGFSSN